MAKPAVEKTFFEEVAELVAREFDACVRSGDAGRLADVAEALAEQLGKVIAMQCPDTEVAHEVLALTLDVVGVSMSDTLALIGTMIETGSDGVYDA